jgi:predicted nucleotidyltransferase
MRLMPESMIQLAREAAIQRARTEGDILAAYLTGSVLDKDPFLGNSADIDLVLIHAGEPKSRREIIAISPDIHLDIKHNPRREYNRPRDLRVHPWLGPEVYNPLLLYDSDHFFQFVQAGLRAKFNAPENIIQRARLNAGHARQIRSDLQSPSADGVEMSLKYLKAINHVANAVAILNGSPLAERRFLLQFPERAEAAGRPDLASSLLGLLGSSAGNISTILASLTEWEKDFLEAASRANVDERIHPARLAYYKKAIEVMLAGEHPQSILWPLIHTWSLAAAVLPPERTSSWQTACRQLGLAGEAFGARLQSFDHFLDNVEELLAKISAVSSI